MAAQKPPLRYGILWVSTQELKIMDNSATIYENPDNSIIILLWTILCSFNLSTRYLNRSKCLGVLDIKTSEHVRLQRGGSWLFFSPAANPSQWGRYPCRKCSYSHAGFYLLRTAVRCKSSSPVAWAGRGRRSRPACWCRTRRTAIFGTLARPFRTMPYTENKTNMWTS